MFDRLASAVIEGSLIHRPTLISLVRQWIFFYGNLCQKENAFSENYDLSIHQIMCALTLLPAQDSAVLSGLDIARFPQNELKH